MFKTNAFRGDKRFWSPIAIACGLTVFFFGVSFLPPNSFVGWVDIAAGVVLLVVGFMIAPFGAKAAEQKPNNSSSTGQGETRLSESVYNVYIEERKQLFKASLDQSKSFDRHILTLSAGAFGLSLLFIRQIVPEPARESLYLLICAWCAFAFSIFLTLLSFLFSQKACFRQMEILDKWLESHGQPNERDKNVFASATTMLNWLSVIAFIAGAVMLIIFSASNLLGVRGG